jgi:hypothetical protein
VSQDPRHSQGPELAPRRRESFGTNPAQDDIYRLIWQRSPAALRTAASGHTFPTGPSRNEKIHFDDESRENLSRKEMAWQTI